MPETRQITDKVTGDVFTYSWKGPGKPTIADVRKIGLERRKAKESIRESSNPPQTLGQRISTSIPEEVMPVVRGIGKIAEYANTPLAPEYKTVEPLLKYTSPLHLISPQLEEDIYEAGVRPLSSAIGLSLLGAGPGIIAAQRAGLLAPRALGATIAATSAPNIAEIPSVVRGERSPEESRDILAGSAMVPLGLAGAISRTPIEYTGEEGTGTFPEIRGLLTEGQKLLTEGQKRLPPAPYPESTPPENIIFPPYRPQIIPPEPTQSRPSFIVSPEGQTVETRGVGETPTVIPPVEDLVRMREGKYLQPEDVKVINEELGFNRPNNLGLALSESEKLQPGATQFPPFTKPETALIGPVESRPIEQIKVAPEPKLETSKSTGLTSLREKLQIIREGNKTNEDIKKLGEAATEPINKEILSIREKLDRIKAAQENVGKLDTELTEQIEKRKTPGISPTGIERRIPTVKMEEELPRSEPIVSLNEGRQRLEEPTKIEEKPSYDEGIRGYEESLDQMTPKNSPSITASIRAGLKAGLDPEDIAIDLAEGGVKEHVAKIIVRRVVEKIKRLAKEEKGFVTPEMLLGKKVSDFISKAKKDPKTKEAAEFQETFFDKYFKQPEYIPVGLKGRMGKSGEELRTLLAKLDQRVNQRSGEFTLLYEKSKVKPGKLTPEEASMQHEILTKDRTKAPKNVVAATRGWINVNKRMGEMAERLGMKMKDIIGEEVPFEKFNPRKYYPRYPEEGVVRDLIGEISKNEKVSFSRARDILNDPNSKYYSRAQHQRIMPEELAKYKVGEESIINHIENFGKQIGTAEILGPDGLESSKVQQLLRNIEEESGVEARNWAEDTLRRYIRPEFKQPSKFEAGLTKTLGTAAGARYLSLFPISNLSNSILTWQKSTPRGFVDGTAKYLYNIVKSQDRARASGSLEQLSSIEYAPAKNFVSKILGKSIDFSEKNIRSWTNEVGRETVIDLMKILKENKSLKSRESFKARLKDLTLENPDALLKRGELTENQLRTAGYQMVKETQGIISPISMPKGLQNGGFFINQALMFKRYAALQTGNTIRAAVENPTKFAATALVVAPILGEVVGDMMATTRGLVAGSITDDAVKNAIIREVGQERGKYYAQIARRMGVDAENAPLVGRLVDNYNRAFILGLVGDIITSAAAGPTEATRGQTPALDIAGELAYDLIKLSTVISEDIDIKKASEPLRKSVIRSTPFGGSAVVRSMEEEPTVSGPTF